MTITPQDIERAERWARGDWQRLSRAADILAKNWLAEFLLKLIAEWKRQRQLAIDVHCLLTAAKKENEAVEAKLAAARA